MSQLAPHPRAQRKSPVGSEWKHAQRLRRRLTFFPQQCRLSLGLLKSLVAETVAVKASLYRL